MYMDILFYAVFIGQIYLVSYYYPKKTYDRNIYVLQNYSIDEFPKLYEHSKFADPVQELMKAIRRYWRLNLAIAFFGFSLLLAMAMSGYKPRMIKENEHILLVVFFFLLQALPHIIAEVSTYKWYKNMRSAHRTSKRTADLKPRRLLDFVSPIYLALAVTAFIGWLVYYLYNKGFTAPWDWQTAVTVLFMTGMNFALVVLAYKHMQTKTDPYQAPDDHQKFTEAMIRIYVFASIMMSLQLIIFGAINQFGLDIFEPIAMSLYFQVCIIFGIGELLRSFKIENVDFEVYKKPTLETG